MGPSFLHLSLCCPCHSSWYPPAIPRNCSLASGIPALVHFPGPQAGKPLSILSQAPRRFSWASCWLEIPVATRKLKVSEFPLSTTMLFSLTMRTSAGSLEPPPGNVPSFCAPLQICLGISRGMGFRYFSFYTAFQEFASSAGFGNS